MGQVRARMAEEAGATVIVTGCPFCLVNLEDGVKTSGLEGKREVMDLTELVAGQISGQKTEDSGQKTEDRGQRTEDRRRKNRSVLSSFPGSSLGTSFLVAPATF